MHWLIESVGHERWDCQNIPGFSQVLTEISLYGGIFVSPGLISFYIFINLFLGLYLIIFSWSRYSLIVWTFSWKTFGIVPGTIFSVLVKLQGQVKIVAGETCGYIQKSGQVFSRLQDIPRTFLTDQAVNTISEIWRPQGIPQAFEAPSKQHHPSPHFPINRISFQKLLLPVINAFIYTAFLPSRLTCLWNWFLSESPPYEDLCSRGSTLLAHLWEHPPGNYLLLKLICSNKFFRAID